MAIKTTLFFPFNDYSFSLIDYVKKINGDFVVASCKGTGLIGKDVAYSVNMPDIGVNVLDIADVSWNQITDFVILNPGDNLDNEQNSICAWGPTAMLPIFQLAGVNPENMEITTKLIDSNKNFDGFTRISFRFLDSVASIKIAKAAKSEGELIITGTKGYIYVPAPWWKTDYFEIRYENQNENKKYFYQLDGEGIRYEIVAFARAVEHKKKNYYISDDISIAIAGVIGKFNDKQYIRLGKGDVNE